MRSDQSLFFNNKSVLQKTQCFWFDSYEGRNCSALAMHSQLRCHSSSLTTTLIDTQMHILIAYNNACIFVTVCCHSEHDLFPCICTNLCCTTSQYCVTWGNMATMSTEVNLQDTLKNLLHMMPCNDKPTSSLFGPSGNTVVKPFSCQTRGTQTCCHSSPICSFWTFKEWLEVSWGTIDNMFNCGALTPDSQRDCVGQTVR